MPQPLTDPLACERPIETIAEDLDRLRVGSAVAVVDLRVRRISGVVERIGQACPELRLAVFDAFTPNPDTQEVAGACSAAATIVPEAIIAIGGGTAIDIAKALRFCLATGLTPRESLEARDPKMRAPLPLIAAPTTGGSGSEATHFATVSVHGKRCGIAHRALRPDVAIIDVSLHEKIPRSVTATSGLDALCQAAESMWSIGSTDESRASSRDAISLLLPAIEGAIDAPNPQNRRDMAVGAHLCGRAIDIARTNAPHALADPLTIHHGVTHGHAVALTIGPVLEFIQGITDEDCVDPRGAAHVRSMVDEVLGVFDLPDAASFTRRIVAIMSAAGLAPNLVEAGIDASALAQIASSSSRARLANCPRRIDGAIEGILRSAARV